MTPSPLDRCAVVTGGAKGIGLAVSRELLDRGAQVVVVDVDEAALAAFADENATRKDSFVLSSADVGTPSDWARIREQAHASFGPVAILVNNAGISPKRDGARIPSAEMPLEEWERVLAVNLTGPFVGCQTMYPDMRELGWGRIVNMSSQAARTGAIVAGVHYGATKSGLLGLTRTLALEFGADGITVNAVTPGRIMTPMAAGVPDSVNQEWARKIPIGRLGQPEDIAAVVGFLVSAEAGFVTGATIDSNGGSYMG